MDSNGESNESVSALPEDLEQPFPESSKSGGSPVPPTALGLGGTKEPSLVVNNMYEDSRQLRETQSRAVSDAETTMENTSHRQGSDIQIDASDIDVPCTNNPVLPNVNTQYQGEGKEDGSIDVPILDLDNLPELTFDVLDPSVAQFKDLSLPSSSARIAVLPQGCDQNQNGDGEDVSMDVPELDLDNLPELNFEVLDPRVSQFKELSVLSKTCPHCDMTFSRVRGLSRHISDVHEQRQDFKCNTCGKPFSRREKVIQHIYSQHKDVMTFQCTACNTSFQTEAECQAHILEKHAPAKPHVCADCGLQYKSLESLLRHHRKKKHGKHKIEVDAST